MTEEFSAGNNNEQRATNDSWLVSPDRSQANMLDVLIKEAAKKEKIKP